MVSPDKHQELWENYKAFQKALPSLLNEHAGKYALMRQGRIVEYFNTPSEALLSARRRYQDDLFSVQEVTCRKADLGWYSRVSDNEVL